MNIPLDRHTIATRPVTAGDASGRHVLDVDPDPDAIRATDARRTDGWLSRDRPSVFGLPLVSPRGRGHALRPANVWRDPATPRTNEGTPADAPRTGRCPRRGADVPGQGCP